LNLGIERGGADEERGDDEVEDLLMDLLLDSDLTEE
jgi:hypothetical protein